MTKVHTARGESLDVLTRKDMMLGLKWLSGLFVTALVVAFGLGQWITGTLGGMQQVHKTLEVRTENIPELTRNVDSLRIEMQHLTRSLATLTERLDRPIGQPSRARHTPVLVPEPERSPLTNTPVEP